MNMQAIMRQAQQMQSDIMKIQKELEKTEYEGNSSLVIVVLNGKKEMLKLTIKDKENLNSDDMDILEDMIVVAFNEAMKKVDADKEKKLNKYKKQIEKSKYSIHELMTLASVVQSEGYNEEDFKNIASVFYNRLKTGIPLESCVTSYYGVKKDMTDELLQKDINAENPYNTRGNNPVKMPIGPISMPGDKALDATFNPIETSYYFFVSDKNNKLYFTKTLNEHEKIIKKLQNEGLWLEW